MVGHLIVKFQESNPDRRVKVDIQPQVFANADKGLFSILLKNLLENAWKFSKNNPSAHIEFGVKRVNGEEQYFVRDNGTGFNEKYSDRLFCAFQRLHSEAEFSGSGIGLAIVQRIIRKHSGHIWAESKLGEGATFYFIVSD